MNPNSAGTIATQSVRLRSKGDGRQRGRASSTADLQRASFLRRCRARLAPADVGLVPSQRSRSIGLRREDVAALSGVSVSWYTWLEQGRRMRVSDEMLDRICRTLRLSDDERIYLYSLVQKRPPQVSSAIPIETPPEMLRLLESLTLPAVVFNLRWDILAWNPQAAALYEDYGKLPVDERNLLDIVFSRPAPRTANEQYDRMVCWLVARARFDYSRSVDDARFEALVHRLCATSPLFRHLWLKPVFTLRAYGHHQYTHERYGRLSFQHTSFSPDGHPKISVTICVPENAAARQAVVAVNAELTLTAAARPSGRKLQRRTAASDRLYSKPRNR